MEIRVYQDYAQMSRAAAEAIAHQIRIKPNSVIGLATGSTPEGMYAELVQMYREGEIDFSKAHSFNLDEYVGLRPDDPRSYAYFMRDKLFGSVNFDPSRVHIPSGLSQDLAGQCSHYEDMMAQAGGIDLQVLGIGLNGHIGFNEPGSPWNSRTRVVDLAEQTVAVNRQKTEAESLPEQAVSMGIGTILEARRIILLANGAGKAEIIERALRGPATVQVPASALQQHPDVTVILDEAAAARISG